MKVGLTKTLGGGAMQSGIFQAGPQGESLMMEFSGLRPLPP